jgi:uncharacterized protein (DUF1697 family)
VPVERGVDVPWHHRRVTTPSKRRSTPKALPRAKAKKQPRPAAKAARAGLAKEQRYAALLRGISPMNAKMAELKRAFEAAGFLDVKTVLASGNVLFSAPKASNAELERKAEAAMQKVLGRTFLTIVRSVEALRRILESDPYRRFRLAADAKRVVTFTRAKPKQAFKLPPEIDGARILCVSDGEIYTAYRPSPKGPVFMVLIEKTLGKEVTTRTWDTVKKLAR